MPDEQEWNDCTEPEVNVAAPGADCLAAEVVKRVASERERAHRAQKKGAVGPVAPGMPGMADVDRQQSAEQQDETRPKQPVDRRHRWLEFAPRTAAVARVIQSVEPAPE